MTKRSCDTGGVMLHPASMMRAGPVTGAGSVWFGRVFFGGAMTSGMKEGGRPTDEELHDGTSGVGGRA